MDMVELGIRVRSREAETATKRLARLRKEGRHVDIAMERMRGSIGKTAAKYAVLGTAVYAAGRAFTSAMRTYTKFASSMANVGSVAGASASQLKQLEMAARNQAKTSVFTASQAADAQYYLASAGMTVNEIIAAQRGVMDLAAATQSDLASTSSTVASALSQFGLEAGESGRVANVFASAISGSQATLEKLSYSMKYVGPVAGSLGLSIEKTTSYLMGLYNAGLGATQAGTTLRGALSRLLKPTKEVSATLDKLKVSTVGTDGKLLDLGVILDRLKVSGASTTDMLRIFGQIAGPGMMSLLKVGGAGLRELEAGITGTDRAAKMAKRQIDHLGGDMKLMSSAAEEAAISFGEKAAPGMREMVQAVTELIKSEAAGDLIALLGQAASLAAATLGKLAGAIEHVGHLIKGTTWQDGLSGMDLYTRGLDRVTVAEIALAKARVNHKKTGGWFSNVDAALEKYQEALNQIGQLTGVLDAQALQVASAWGVTAKVLGDVGTVADNLATQVASAWGGLSREAAVLDAQHATAVEAAAKARVTVVKKAASERLGIEQDLASQTATLGMTEFQRRRHELDQQVEEYRKHGQSLVGIAEDVARLRTQIDKDEAAGKLKVQQDYEYEVAKASGDSLRIREIERTRFVKSWTDQGLAMADADKLWLLKSGKEHKSALQTMVDGYQSAGEMIQGGMASTWHSVGSLFTSSVTSLVQGDLNGMVDGFKSFGMSILDSWINLLAQMIAQWAMSGLASILTGGSFSFGGGGGGVGGSVGSSVVGMGVTALGKKAWATIFGPSGSEAMMAALSPADAAFVEGGSMLGGSATQAAMTAEWSAMNAEITSMAVTTSAAGVAAAESAALAAEFAAINAEIGMTAVAGTTAAAASGTSAAMGVAGGISMGALGGVVGGVIIGGMIMDSLLADTRFTPEEAERFFEKMPGHIERYNGQLAATVSEHDTLTAALDKSGLKRFIQDTRIAGGVLGYTTQEMDAYLETLGLLPDGMLATYQAAEQMNATLQILGVNVGNLSTQTVQTTEKLTLLYQSFKAGDMSAERFAVAANDVANSIVGMTDSINGANFDEFMDQLDLVGDSLGSVSNQANDTGTTFEQWNTNGGQPNSGGVGVYYHDGGWIKAHRGTWVGGMRSDERGPYVLQTGERVLSRQEVYNAGGSGAVDRLAQGGRNQPSIHLSFDGANFNASDPEGTADVIADAVMAAFQRKAENGELMGAAPVRLEVMV